MKTIGEFYIFEKENILHQEDEHNRILPDDIRKWQVLTRPVDGIQFNRAT